MLVFLVLVFALYLLGYLYVQKKYRFWKEAGVPYIDPKFPYGNTQPIAPKMHDGLLFKRYYDQMKDKAKVVGMYFFLQPFIMINDLEVIKNILVKDFQYFMNRGIFYDDKADPLAGHLFLIENQKWKNLRVKLTPTFTSGKMKYMFPTIMAVANEFKTFLNDEINISHELEMKEILARFTTDVIGSVAFGIDCNSMKNPEAEFRTFGRKIFAPSIKKRIKFFFGTLFPKLARKIGVSLRDQKSIDFFVNSVKQTVEYREMNNLTRNDFMDLLLNLKSETNMSIEEIAAQAFVFFVAGFETSSTAMSYALYELAMHKDIQTNAREEVQRILKRHNGEFTYDSLMEMKYINKIINESLRKYPPGVIIRRAANANYLEPHTGITIKEGTDVFIPVYAIHHDPEFYPNPDIFEPERFTDEEIQNRNPYTFLPFGEGPRNCIGLRFGMLQTKIGLAMLLNNFTFSKTPSVPDKLEFQPDRPVLTIKGDLKLRVDKI